MKKKKPITVLDAEHKKIGTTYSHRAQGLLIKGRARFIDENTIILDEGVPPCPPDENVNLEDIEMKELVIDNNEIVESGFGEIVETGKNAEAEIVEEAAVENVSETAEVFGNVTEAEILDELNALLGCITRNSLNTFAYDAIEKATQNLVEYSRDAALDEECLDDLKGTIEKIIMDYHESIRKLMDVYSILLGRIKANNENGADNKAEAVIFSKLNNLRENLLNDNDSVFKSCVSVVAVTSAAICDGEPSLKPSLAIYKGFAAIRTISGENRDSINKLLEIYISMLSR